MASSTYNTIPVGYIEILRFDGFDLYEIDILSEGETSCIIPN